MQGTPTRLSDERLRGWSTRDLLIVAAIGVGLGLALIPVIYAGFALRAALGPLATVLYTGLFFLPGLMSLYVVQRPGASIINGLFMALVWIPLTPFGLAVVMPTLVARIGSEVPFLFTRYRSFRLPVLLAGGALAGILALALIYVPFGYLNLAPVLQVILIVGHAIGGALLGGLLAKLLSEAVAKTGVLSAYAIGRERGEGRLIS